MASTDAIRFVDRLLSKTDAQIRAILATLPPVIVPVQDDGSVTTNQHRILNFIGDGVTIANNTALRRTDIFIPGSPSASATSTFVSTAGLEKVFPVGSKPANWFLPGFNDSGWASSVLESHNITAAYTVTPGSSWITETSQNGDIGATDGLFLARRTFTLPAGSIVSATLEINYDDNLGDTPGMWINGNAVTEVSNRGGSAPYGAQTYNLPIAWLNVGTTNVLAVDVFSQAGAVALSYRIIVNMAQAGVDAQYQLVAEKDQPDGYAGLDGAGFVDLGELGSGAPSGSNFLRGDGTWAAASTNALTVKEIDGTPSVSATVVEFPNGSLADQGGGTVRYTAPAAPSYVCIQDQKTDGTEGGSFTSGAWRTRDLNTEVNDPDGIAALSSNQITLAAGTYQCRISAPAAFCQTHKARLQNVTDAATVLLGTTENADAGGTFVVTRSFIVGQFTIAASKALEVQHRCTTTRNTNGFGGSVGGLGTEVYTIAEFWRVG